MTIACFCLWITWESAEYPESDLLKRTSLELKYKTYIQGLLYFLSTDSRIPEQTREVISSWGLCKDEFTDNGGWPYRPYVREARRMIGSYVMTYHDVAGETTITDSIGLGGYQIDSHIVNRYASGGQIMAEGSFLVPVKKPYPISYQVMTPKEVQVTNLLVSVDISASHVAYASLRVEPTFMIIGQAAGAAASLAIDEGVSVQAVDYNALSKRLQKDKQVLSLQ